MLVLDLGNSTTYLYSEGSIYETLTDDEAQSILDENIALASEGSYYEFANNVFSQVYSLLSSAGGTSGNTTAGDLTYSNSDTGYEASSLTAKG